jgi:beta-1,4-mannosyl-glycoprotein beta-1,4-N-acetylglucosaminyltransferase
MVFIDTFLFNGDWIVKLRLKYLSDYVDYFYVVESWYTHSGQKKEFLYTEKYKDWFEPYASKVRFHILTEPFSTTSAWIEENSQRNAILPRIIADFPKGNYHLAVCDADEIYRTDVIGPKNELMQGTVLFPQMSLYYYNFTHLVQHEPWTMPFIIHSSQILPTTDLNQIRINKKSRGQEFFVKAIPNAGWHFSFFMSIEDMQRKIVSFCHTDLNTSRNSSLQNIRESLLEGRDVFGRNIQIKMIPLHMPIHSYPLWFAEFHRELLESQEITGA